MISVLDSLDFSASDWTSFISASREAARSLDALQHEQEERREKGERVRGDGEREKRERERRWRERKENEMERSIEGCIDTKRECVCG